MAKLGEVCTFYAGTGFPTEHQGEKNGDYPFYKVGDISKNVQAGYRELQFCDNYINKDIALKIKGVIVPSDTVVFAKIGEALKLNRRALTKCDCLIDNNAMGIKANSDKLDIGYFYHYMCNLDMQNYSESTTVPSVRKSKIMNIDIKLPLIEEQQKIAEKLDKVSDLIGKRKQQLEKLDELVKSRFIEMFDKKDNSYVELISVIEEGAGLSYGIVQPGDDGTGDMGVLRPVDIVDGKIVFDSIKYIDRSIGDGFRKTELKGTELLITVRGTTGITALTDKRFSGMNVTRGIAVIRYNRAVVNPLYLNSYLQTDESQQYIQEHTRGATLKQINLSDLRVMKIMLPPLDAQNKFAAFMEQIDKSKLAIQKSLDKLETLKKALMQEYFG